MTYRPAPPWPTPARPPGTNSGRLVIDGTCRPPPDWSHLNHRRSYTTLWTWLTALVVSVGTFFLMLNLAPVMRWFMGY